MTAHSTLSVAIAYWDVSDPACLGWAYRLIDTDGGHESGPLDTEDAEDAGGVLMELEALVMSRGGEWHRPEYSDADAGSYVWRA